METQPIQAVESTPAPSTDNEEFKRKVEESKRTIAEAQTAPPKRGRGRPPKPKPPIETLPPPSENPSAAPVPPPDISVYVKQPLIAISKIPAVNYKIPELQLTDEEAEACAESLNQIVLAFIPDMTKMDPKTASVLGACTVFGAVCFQKYAIYQQNRKDKVKKPENEVQEEINETQKTSGIQADNYFARQVV